MYLLDQLLHRNGVRPTAFDVASLLPVHFLYAHDRNTFKIVDELDRLHIEQTAYHALEGSNRTLFFMDHYSPAPTLEAVALHAQQRAVSRAMGGLLFEEGSGVGHQLALEHAVQPGQIAAGVDSHTCTVGAIGALGLRMPPVSIAKAVISGTIEFYRPRIVRIELINKLVAPTSGKDVALYLAAQPTVRFTDALLEIGGPGLESLNLADRISLANLATDLHARSALFEIDEVLVGALGVTPSLISRCSAVEYHDVITVDLSAVVPFVSLPGSIHSAVPFRSAGRVKVDVVTVGSCTNGQTKDFADFCDAIGDGPIADHVRLVATPPSSTVLRELSSKGILSKLVEVGATINPPGCGPCMGLHQGLLGDGEVCVATGSRNSAGRMGSNNAQIFLASPWSAGIAARHGYIGG